MTDQRLKDKLALVTGASRGIGRAVALALADEGAHVILLARRVGALEDLDDEIRENGGSATLVKLDLTDFEKVDAIGPTLYERWGKLDILIGNAGILGPLSPIGHISEDSWNDVFNTNVHANWRLMRTCDPLLRASEAGRAVFVTSGAAAAKRAYWAPYSASKAALEALVLCYAHEVENTQVRVNLLNPGPVRTAMRARAFPGEDPETLPQPEELVPLFLDLIMERQTANGKRFDFKRTNNQA